MIDTTGNFGPGSTRNHFHYTINKVTIISFPLIDNETWFNIHDLWYNFIMNVYFNIGVFFNRCVYWGIEAGRGILRHPTTRRLSGNQSCDYNNSQSRVAKTAWIIAGFLCVTNTEPADCCRNGIKVWQVQIFLIRRRGEHPHLQWILRESPRRYGSYVWYTMVDWPLRCEVPGSGA